MIPHGLFCTIMEINDRKAIMTKTSLTRKYFYFSFIWPSRYHRREHGSYKTCLIIIWILAYYTSDRTHCVTLLRVPTEEREFLTCVIVSIIDKSFVVTSIVFSVPQNLLTQDRS